MIIHVCSSTLKYAPWYPEYTLYLLKEERNDIELGPCEKGDKRAEKSARKQPLLSFGIFLSSVPVFLAYMYIFLYLAVMIRSLFSLLLSI